MPPAGVVRCTLGRGEDGDPAAFFGKMKGYAWGDMCELPKLTSDAILENLRKRFEGELVYTYVGDIVCSVNPFKNVGCVGKAIRSRYRGAQRHLLPPHIYSLVDQCFTKMMAEQHSQSILISGESGAGKTEAMKICLTYIGELSKKGAGASNNVAEQLMQTNPVMEAIGNAKTVRNNNSSRFGKHFDVQFSAEGQILGAFTSSYLLEKRPRIVQHLAGERNYHVFYMLCKADAFVRSPVNIGRWEEYAICSQEGTITQVTTWDDDAEFRDMHEALLQLGFSEVQRDGLYTLMSICLHVGNLRFAAAGQGSAVTSEGELDLTATMMGISHSQLASALTSRTMGGGAIEKFLKPLEPRFAEIARSSLCMHVYSLAFDWCVDVINEYISKPGAAFCVGVLDIFGFENFTINSFPQLCINFTNESLHNLFIDFIFRQEQEIYVREEVQWQFVEYEDNQPVIDLISKRPACVLGLLDEGCATGTVTDAGVLANYNQTFAKHKAFSRPKVGSDRSFTITHYAGNVTYAVEGWIEKNKDELSTDIIELLTVASNFDELRTLALRDEAKKADAAAAAGTGKRGKGGGGGLKKKTVSKAFGESLGSLMSKLRTTDHHYIRCLKPNQTLKSGDWDNDFMLKQLAYSGTLEVTQIRKAGLNVRKPLKHFFQYYKVCAEEPQALRAGTITKRCQLLLEQLGPVLGVEEFENKFRVGKTLVFLKDYEIIIQLDRVREYRIVEYVISLQSFFRMVPHLRSYRAIRRAAIYIQGYVCTVQTREAYLEVRRATGVVQRGTRRWLLRKAYREIRQLDIPAEEKRVQLQRALLKVKQPGKTARASNRRMSVFGERRSAAQWSRPKSGGIVPFFQARHEGWLLSLNRDGETLQKRWAVLRLGTLSFYLDETLARPIETFDLSRYSLNPQDAEEAAVLELSLEGSSGIPLTRSQLRGLAQQGRKLTDDAVRPRGRFTAGGSRRSLSLQRGMFKRAFEQGKERLLGSERDGQIALIMLAAKFESAGAQEQLAASWRLSLSTALTEAASVRAFRLPLSPGGAEEETEDKDALENEEGDAKPEQPKVEPVALRVLKEGWLHRKELTLTAAGRRALVSNGGSATALAASGAVPGGPNAAAGGSGDSGGAALFHMFDRKTEHITRHWEVVYAVVTNDGALSFYEDKEKERLIGATHLRAYALESMASLDHDFDRLHGGSGTGRSAGKGGLAGGKQKRKLGAEGEPRSGGGGGGGGGRPPFVVADGVLFQIIEGRQFQLCAGPERIRLAFASPKMCDEWFDTLQLVTAASYLLSPVFKQHAVTVTAPTGEAVRVPITGLMRCRDVVRAVCTMLGLAFSPRLVEWGLVERRSGDDGLERRVPADEPIADKTLLAWEVEVRRRHGMLAAPPRDLYTLHLQRTALAGPLGARLPLELAQAQRDLREGVFTGPDSPDEEAEAYDLAALAVLATRSNVKEQWSDALAAAQPARHSRVAFEHSAAEGNRAGNKEKKGAAAQLSLNVAGVDGRHSVEPAIVEQASQLPSETLVSFLPRALLAPVSASSMAEASVGRRTSEEPDTSSAIDGVPAESSWMRKRRGASEMRRSSRSRIFRRSSLGSSSQVGGKRAKVGGMASSGTSADAASLQTRAADRVRAALHELVVTEVELTPSTTPTRRLVHDHRMSHEMNAQAATRILVDRLRRSPRCFAAQFSVTLWNGGALELDALVSYTGLHLYVAGDAKGLLASYTFDGSLVGWVAVNAMLVVTVIHGSTDASSGEKRQLKNLHLLSSETAAMRALLSTYAEAVADERSKQRSAQQACHTARRRADSIIMTHRSKGGQRKPQLYL